jgi:WD40 repeat protein
VPTTLKVDSRGEVLAVGQGKRASGVALFNVKTGTRLHMYKTTAEITALSFVGEDLFFSDLDGRIYRWAHGKKSAKPTMKSPKRIMNMAVHPSGTSAVIGGTSGVHFVDLQTKTVGRQLLKSWAMDIRFSADGDKVAIALRKTLHLPKIPSVYVFENTLR